MRFLAASVLLLSLLSAGLSFPQPAQAFRLFGKAYETPQSEAPLAESWQQLGEQERLEVEEVARLTSNFPEQEWWRAYNDGYLNSYIERALQANHVLAEAEARITEAKALADATRANELPQLSVGANYTLQRFSDVQFPISNRGGGGFGNVGVAGKWVDFFNAPLEASYEADIWQKNRDRTRAANELSAATLADYHNVRVQLVSEVVAAYVDLMRTDSLIDRQQQAIAQLQDDLRRAESLYASGLQAIDTVKVRQQSVESAEASLAPLIRIRVQQLNRLAVLMGLTPAQVATLERASLDDWMMPDALSVGLPSELVLHRPDVQTVENQLRRAYLDVRAARKAFLPTINLSANIGFFSATDFSDWFSPDALGGALAAGIAQPLFTGGRLKANLKLSKAQYEQLLHRYQNTLLEAFAEVENSLAAWNTHQQEYDSVYAQLSAKNREIEAIEARARAGLIAQGELYPQLAQRALLEQNVATLKASLFIDQVSLYKALGGGYVAPDKKTL